ncbi:non-specific lipid-transfer protein 1-like [Henckelia pumila]|uniref:non-specific lipid-transfer protein 1-like n=1 Tax=Henckelia pumila TaxID=405737 RepID=UPI003C6E0F30
MAYNSGVFIGILVLSMVVANMPGLTQSISCAEALEFLLPCQSFLMGSGDISVPCCQGTKALSQASSTQADRQSVCQCLKQAAASVNVNVDRAKQLPQLCNVSVPVPVQPDVNCDAIPVVVGLMNRYKNMEIKALEPSEGLHL